MGFRTKAAFILKPKYPRKFQNIIANLSFQKENYKTMARRSEN